MDLQELYALVKAWRLQQQDHSERSQGYVVVFQGKVAGWKRHLDNESGWMPGCLAVCTTGTVYCAKGGDPYNGAKRWEKVTDKLA